MSRPLALTSLLLLPLALLSLQCNLFPSSGDSSAIAAALALLPDDHVLGSASAPVTVIEYADFQCPFCGQFSRDTFPTIKTNYIDTGKVRWVFRHFPLTRIHYCAQNAARAAECADDQSKFFDLGEEMFRTQSTLFTTSGLTCTADLSVPATTVGLDLSTFTPCAASDSKDARIQRDLTSGTTAGVPGTPCSGSRYRSRP